MLVLNVKKVLFVWLMDLFLMKDVLKCVLTVYGVLSVMMVGIQLMLILFAHNWVTLNYVRETYVMSCI